MCFLARMKALAARAMATVASKLGDSLPRLDQKTLLAFLVNALGGRTWNGKESVLLAVRDLVSSANAGIKAILTNDENLKEELLVDQVKATCEAFDVGNVKPVKLRKTYRTISSLSA